MRAPQAQEPVSHVPKAHALLELGKVALDLNDIDLARALTQVVYGLAHDARKTAYCRAAACSAARHAGEGARSELGYEYESEPGEG